jgi:hypothetical protein
MRRWRLAAAASLLGVLSHSNDERTVWQYSEADEVLVMSRLSGAK